MKVKTESRSLSELLESFYEDNPRQHSLDLDIKKLSDRLLTLGWCEHVALNAKNGKIVDGHGRVLAAEYLSQQSPEWFTEKLKGTTAKGDRVRYAPDYWLSIPVVIGKLDSESHSAMTIGLNLEKAQGVDDPEKMAAIAFNFSDEDRELSGFAVKMKAIATQLQDSKVEEESTEIEEPKKFVLNLAVEWKDWKKWRDWKIANNCDSDADAFWDGMQEVLESEGICAN